MVSSSAWLATTASATSAVRPAGSRAAFATIQTIVATANANANECVAPRCPHGSAYRTPSRNPITSTSGNNDNPDQNTAAATGDQIVRWPVRYAFDAAAPTSMCPMLATGRTLAGQSTVIGGIEKSSQDGVWLPSAAGWFHRYSAGCVVSWPAASTTSAVT